MKYLKSLPTVPNNVMVQNLFRKLKIQTGGVLVSMKIGQDFLKSDNDLYFNHGGKNWDFPKQAFSNRLT